MMVAARVMPHNSLYSHAFINLNVPSNRSVVTFLLLKKKSQRHDTWKCDDAAEWCRSSGHRMANWSVPLAPTTAPPSRYPCTHEHNWNVETKLWWYSTWVNCFVFTLVIHRRPNRCEMGRNKQREENIWVSANFCDFHSMCTHSGGLPLKLNDLKTTSTRWPGPARKV